MTPKYIQTLHQKMIKSHNNEELMSLAFYLGIDLDNLEGNSKPAKIRELISYMGRKGILLDLIKVLRVENPTIEWDTPPEANQQIEDAYSNISEVERNEVFQEYINDVEKHINIKEPFNQSSLSFIQVLTDNVWILLDIRRKNVALSLLNNFDLLNKLSHIDRNLSETNLSGMNLSGANFNKAIFNKANLSYANLQSSWLENSNLLDANLERANLNFAKASNANFQNANLTRATMRMAIFASFSTKGLVPGAQPTGANFQNANLQGADLSSARFSGFIDGANLSGADLRWTDLSNSNLKRAKLTGANLEGANLEGAELPNLFGELQ